jgi:uncharacterized protein YacL (UPF0231 family)
VDKEVFAKWLRAEISHAKQALNEIEAFESQASDTDEYAKMLVRSKPHYEYVIKTNGEILARIEARP